MIDTEFQHSEAFLQWIWENVLFDFTQLKTQCGKKLQIKDAGRLNKSDGPDFKYAAIEVGGLSFHGDIEIHTKAKNWNQHGHQKDENFNSVILHVVADNEAAAVHCADNTSPFTLNILPHLSAELHRFLHSFEHSEVLPCASSFNYISEDAFALQVQKAHEEYFEKKADDFLQFYDPEISPSKAWKHALIISLWDGLGISHNRAAMRQVARVWLAEMCDNSLQNLEIANRIAGFDAEESAIHWNLKSVRPNNHPQKRIEEAVMLCHQIMSQPFEDFLNTGAIDLWNFWFGNTSLKNTGRFKILFGTVYLPALYILGNLYAHAKLSDEVFSQWLSLKSPIPASLLSKFNRLNLSDGSYRKKLGAVHQLKSYCGTGSCSECLVLKKAIAS